MIGVKDVPNPFPFKSYIASGDEYLDDYRVAPSMRRLFDEYYYNSLDQVDLLIIHSAI